MTSTSPYKPTVEIAPIPQQKPWPRRYSPEELNGKTCSAILPKGKELAEEYLQYMQKLGIIMKPQTVSEAVDLFLVVDDSSWRTDSKKPEVQEILKRATESNLPIYPLSYFRLCARAIDTPTKRDAAADSLTLEEEIDEAGRLVLKLDGEDFSERISKNEHEAFDELGRQTLFKDPYVKFIAGLPEEQREQLSNLVVDGPPRIAGTRWKADAVLNSYLAAAWEPHGDSWTFVFNEEKFAKDHEHEFGLVEPVAAIRAAISAFLRKPELYFG